MSGQPSRDKTATAGEPAAHPVPLAYVLWGLIALAGAAALVIALSREQRRDELARAGALASFRAQHMRSEAQLAGPRDAVNQMLTQVTDELAASGDDADPGRRGMLENALNFYRGLLVERGGADRAQSAMAWLRIGDISALLGRHDAAEEAYQESIALFTQLAADAPEILEHTRQLAVAHRRLGDLLRSMGALARAEEAFHVALSLATVLTEQAPDVPDYGLELARVGSGLAGLYAAAGRSDDSEAEYGRAITILEALSGGEAAVPAYRFELARSLIGCADLLAGRSPAQAESAYARAGTVLDGLAAEYPRRPEYRRAYAACSLALGDLLLRGPGHGRDADVARCYRRALALYEGLAGDFPGDPGHRKDLADGLGRLASLLATTDAPEADRLLDRSRRLRDELEAQARRDLVPGDTPGQR